MPDMDGFALLQELRKRFPGLPAIVMTAHCNDREVDAGRYDVYWLPKPFTRLQLRTAIGTVLKSSHCTVQVVG
jgi:two-component system nitrogen regulation response regulator GlnG